MQSSNSFSSSTYWLDKAHHNLPTFRQYLIDSTNGVSVRELDLALPKSIKTVCLLRLSAIGDIVNLLPSLEEFIVANPHIKLTWVIGKGEYTLFQYWVTKFSNIELVVFDKNVSYIQARSQLQALNQGRDFDLLLHMQTSMRSNVLAFFIKAKTKIGYAWDRAYEGQWLITKSLPKVQSFHVMYDYLELFLSATSICKKKTSNNEDVTNDHFFAYGNNYDSNYYYSNYEFLSRYVGRIIDNQELSYTSDQLIDLGVINRKVTYELVDEQQEIKIQTQLTTKGRSLLSADNLALIEVILANQQWQNKLILINPCSSALKKNWPAAKYVTVAKHLLDQGYSLLITGSKNPKELAFFADALQEIEEYAAQIAEDNRRSFAPLINLVGKTSLIELWMFLSIVRLVVSPDSGPMHIASIVGTPTLGLFAYINPMRSGPVQHKIDVISVYHQNLLANSKEYKSEQINNVIDLWQKAYFDDQIDLANYFAQLAELDNNKQQEFLTSDLNYWRIKPSSDQTLMDQISEQQVIKRIEKLLARKISFI